MRNIWWLIIAAVIIQEPVSSDAAIFQIRHLHLNLIEVNLVWLIATIADLTIGYWIGKFVQKKIAGTKFEKRILRIVTAIENFMGKKGEKFTLVLLGIINFPYANSFIASWFDIPLRQMFALLFIGDVLYWGIEWGINIGVRSFPINPHTALLVVLLVAFLFAVLSKFLLNKVFHAKK